MENDVEVVEKLSQPPPVQSRSPPTRPGDVTSTTSPGFDVPEASSLDLLPVLDLSEELVRLNNMHEEVAREAMNYIANMNAVGVFMESLEIGPLPFNPHLPPHSFNNV